MSEPTKALGRRTTSRSRVLSYEAALAAARRAFLKESGLEMDSLARNLAVSRATLYRVVRSRDRLIGDVIWFFGERTLALAIAETKGSGVERIVETARTFNAYVVSFEPLRTFVRAEPMAALRVLITPAGGLHQRNVEAWKEIFLEAERNGELELPFDADELAYVFVRIGESMLYSELLAGREPDIDVAALVQRALLRHA
ncbi:MAG: QsdR family transcriptional regulator [Actinomycetota bacterium]|nr:hypothetical protein [Actinomycetota bacterium]